MVERTNNTWKDNKQKIIEALGNKQLLDYLSSDKLKELQDKCEDTTKFTEDDYTTLVYLLFFTSFSYFLSTHDSGNEIN